MRLATISYRPTHALDFLKNQETDLTYLPKVTKQVKAGFVERRTAHITG